MKLGIAFPAVLALLSVSSALARTREEVLERTVVRGRLYEVANRFEVSPIVGFGLLNQMTSHINFNLALAYNFSDVLGLELRGGYALSSNTSLAKQASEKLLSKADPVITDDFTNSWQLKFNTVLGVRWAPIYGKVSLFAEVPVHFQAYLTAGGGLGTFHRQSVVFCTAPVLDQSGNSITGSCASWFQEDRTSWLATGAVGMRFFSHKSGAIKIEIRDYAFRDSYLVQIERARGLAGLPTGARARNPSLNSIVFFEIGYAFVF